MYSHNSSGKQDFTALRILAAPILLNLVLWWWNFVCNSVFSVMCIYLLYQDSSYSIQNTEKKRKEEQSSTLYSNLHTLMLGKDLILYVGPNTIFIKFNYLEACRPTRIFLITIGEKKQKKAIKPECFSLCSVNFTLNLIRNTSGLTKPSGYSRQAVKRFTVEYICLFSTFETVVLHKQISR